PARAGTPEGSRRPIRVPRTHPRGVTAWGPGPAQAPPRGHVEGPGSRAGTPEGSPRGVRVPRRHPRGVTSGDPDPSQAPPRGHVGGSGSLAGTPQGSRRGGQTPERVTITRSVRARDAADGVEDAGEGGALG